MTCTCNNPDVGFCNLHEGKGVSPEPTTAEAFERVRDGLSLAHKDKDPITQRRALDALALLERRLRALEES